MFSAPTAAPPPPKVESDVADQPPVKPKKRRHANNTACDHCRQRKVGCDGRQPCGVCLIRNGDCHYSIRDATGSKKRQRTETGYVETGIVEAVVRRPAAPPTRTENNMNNALMFNFYLKMFHRHVNPILQIYDPYRPVLMPDAPTPAESLEMKMTLALAARGLGHVAVAQELYDQARPLAAELSHTFEAGVAMGYLLMTLYAFGEDNRATQHFAILGYSLSQHCPDNIRMRHLRSLIERSRFMEGTQRAYRGPRITQRTSFSLGVIAANKDAAIDPLTEELLDFIRTFPVQSEFADLSCQLFMLERYPVDKRTNEFMPYQQADMLLDSIYQGERIYSTFHQLSAGEADAVTSMFMAVMKGARTFICAAAGLVELGCRFARETWAAVQAVPPMLVGFNYGMMSQAILHVAQFAWMYKRNPYSKDTDYTTFLLLVAESLRPLSNLYKSVERAYTIIMKAALENTEGPPHFNAGPMDETAASKWAHIPEEAPAVAALSATPRASAPSSFSSLDRVAPPPPALSLGGSSLPSLVDGQGLTGLLHLFANANGGTTGEGQSMMLNSMLSSMAGSVGNLSAGDVSRLAAQASAWSAGGGANNNAGASGGGGAGAWGAMAAAAGVNLAALAGSLGSPGGPGGSGGHDIDWVSALLAGGAGGLGGHVSSGGSGSGAASAVHSPAGYNTRTAAADFPDDGDSDDDF